MTNNVNTTNVAPTNEQTINKAHAILRARLPYLTDNALNFEKRTGNFFKSSIVTDENGDEKVRRLVVEDSTIPTECADEMRAKRASAYVLGYEGALDKANKAIADAEKALADAIEYRDQLTADHAEACALVDGFELPEKAKRETLAVQVDKQKSEIDKLRAMLLAAGIDPDAE